MTKNKHLTNEERKQIEQLLRENVSIKKIAQKLGKSTSTISREIRAHALDTIKWPSYRVHNNCVKRTDCNIQYLCGDEKPNCTKRCSPCRNLCNTLCKHYDEELCYKLHEPPYVCNGCSFEYQCVLHKKYYFNKKAHDAYRETLVESRTGANITEDEIQRLDALVSPLVRRGQSVHHIIVNNPDQFDVSEKSIYRYIDAGLLQARNIDMPRVCRIKPRKSKPVAHKVDKKCRIGRTYPEFKNFMESNDVHAVEMDTVLGRIGGKVLLTLMFKSCDFMLAFIRDHNTSQSVIDIFNSIYQLLGVDCFRKMFPVILTDNGSEFSNPKALESDAQGDRRTSIFYCDPYASFQKPNVELNHEFVRKIFPKGKTLDKFTQDDISLAMSHINSYSREKLNDKAPFELFGFLYGYDTLNKLGLQRIPPNEIILKPTLFKGLT